MSFQNKTVLITGASRGIGKAIGLRLAKEGANIVIASKSVEENPKLGGTIYSAAEEMEKAGGKALLVSGDVTDSSICKQIVDKTVAGFGRIDVLINNAGGLVQRAPIEAITDELFDQVINLNVRSTMICTGVAAQHMRRQGSGGAIINVTSVAARHGGGPGASLYAGSKGFVSTITHGLAKELVKDNIRVNAVAPGVITTPFHDRYSTPQMLESFKASIPMNRLGRADECAGAFLFLASEQLSGYMTGQILEVNGGQYMP